MKNVDVVLGIVRRADRILICQRRSDNPHLPGYWEFPGGKVEPGESLEACLGRELMEELAIRVRVVKAIGRVEHTYPAVRVTLHPFLCDWLLGEPQPLACEQLRWISPAELPRYRFPPANAGMLSEVSNWFAETAAGAAVAPLTY